MISAYCFRDHVGGNWLRTPLANRFFFAASLGSILFILDYATLTLQLLPNSLPPVSNWVLWVLTATACFAWEAIYFGMLYYWFIHDRHRNWWLLGLAILPFFSMLYYFLIFRREVAQLASPQNLIASSATP